MNYKLASAFVLSLALIACGGGGGGSSSGPAPGSQPEQEPEPEPKEQPDNTEIPSAAQAAWIEGVYEANFSDDEGYYYIDGQGVFHTYDYMNDGVDSEGNCYKPAADLKMNYQLEGKQFYYRASEREFSTFVADRELKLILADDINEIEWLHYNGLTSGSGIKLKIDRRDGEDVYLRLSIQTDPVVSPTIEDLNAGLCE